MHHANRQGTQVGLIVCDLDKFKAINDTHGHHIGDEVLIQFSQALRECVRDSDCLFRFGGDEFSILVENASNKSLHMIETRIDSALSKNPLLTKYHVACSLGYTFMTRGDNEKSLFERADAILYSNKMNTPRTFSVV